MLYIVTRNKNIILLQTYFLNIIPSLLPLVGGGAICHIRIQQSQNYKNDPEFLEGAIFFLFADQCNVFRKIFINVGPASHNSHVLEPFFFCLFVCLHTSRTIL